METIPELPRKGNICENHSGHVIQINRNTKDVETLYDLIEKIRNRLPVWATFAFMLLTLIIGWLISKVHWIG